MQRAIHTDLLLTLITLTGVTQSTTFNLPSVDPVSPVSRCGIKSPLTNEKMINARQRSVKAESVSIYK